LAQAILARGDLFAQADWDTATVALYRLWPALIRLDHADR